MRFFNSDGSYCFRVRTGPEGLEIKHFPVSTNFKWKPMYLISLFLFFLEWALGHTTTFFIQVPLLLWPTCYIFRYCLQISSGPPWWHQQTRPGDFRCKHSAFISDECGRSWYFVLPRLVLALWWNKRLKDDGYIFVFCDLLSSYCWDFFLWHSLV